ncbi:hypothetical protein [Streptomyces cupreus]|nr:hypothetical protein [Streptomyces cupreus]
MHRKPGYLASVKRTSPPSAYALARIAGQISSLSGSRTRYSFAI